MHPSLIIVLMAASMSVLSRKGAAEAQIECARTPLLFMVEISIRVEVSEVEHPASVIRGVGVYVVFYERLEARSSLCLTWYTMQETAEPVEASIDV